MITVSILHGETATLKYLEALIAGSPGMGVAATYSSGRDALAGIRTIVPDVFVLDLVLPDIAGIEVIQVIRARSVGTEILVFTACDDRGHLFDALRSGAKGYLLKGTAPAVIIRGIEVIAQGASPLSPRMARQLIDEFCGTDSFGSSRSLSMREKDILSGFERGFTEGDLADKLALSRHTVHSHVKKIYKKLGANSKVEAIRKARERGLI